MITGLDHVTILVRDWEGTIEQYKKIFGTDQVRFSPPTPGRGYKAAHIDFGNGQNIEIITPTDENGPWAQRLAKNGDGIYLFSLSVDDVEQTAAEMRARGVRLPEPIAGLQVIHPSSAGGALVLMSQQR
ncbi:MAG: VOC family protein [Dehalococcoidia bacterium]